MKRSAAATGPWFGEVMRLLAVLVLFVAATGGCGTPSAHTFSRNYGLREDLPVDPPGPQPDAEDECTNGGRLFKLYCGSCHNARPLGERPFSNYSVAIAHMRSQAYLTGKEYRQIIMFLRRWDNVGPPTPPVGPSPKRLIYSQPLSQLRGQAEAGASAPPSTAASPFQRPGPAETPPAPAPRAAGSSPPQEPAAGLPAPIQSN
jgi:hypothetical protein